MEFVVLAIVAVMAYVAYRNWDTVKSWFEGDEPEDPATPA